MSHVAHLIFTPERERVGNAWVLAGQRTLSECFKLFDIIHKVTTEHSTISRITCEVAEDFAADNVIYLELRTTPKVHDDRVA